MGVALRVPESEDHAGIGFIEELVLCRVADAKGATRSEILRDIGALTSHKLSPSELRRSLDRALARNRRIRPCNGDRAQRYKLTGIKAARLRRTAISVDVHTTWRLERNSRRPPRRSWRSDLHEQSGNANQSRRAHPDGLRAAILQQALRPAGPAPTDGIAAAQRTCRGRAEAGIRQQDQERHRIRPRAQRPCRQECLPASWPSGHATSEPTHASLAALAAEACGSTQTDAASLRTAILRNAVVTTHANATSRGVRSTLPSVPRHRRARPIRH